MLHVILADGFEEIEAFTTIDILRRCGISVTTVSITGKRVVTGAHNIRIMADGLFRQSAVTSSECIILPGGMPGVINLYACEGLKKVLRSHVSHGRLTAAICAAPIVLGRLNLLNNHRVTCYPGCENDLYGAKYTGATVEADATFITANGPGAAMAFAFAITRRFATPSVIKRVKDALQLPNPAQQGL